MLTLVGPCHYRYPRDSVGNREGLPFSPIPCGLDGKTSDGVTKGIQAGRIRKVKRQQGRGLCRDGLARGLCGKGVGMVWPLEKMTVL